MNTNTDILKGVKQALAGKKKGDYSDQDVEEMTMKGLGRAGVKPVDIGDWVKKNAKEIKSVGGDETYAYLSSLQQKNESRSLKTFVKNVLMEDAGSEVYALEFNSDLTDLPIPEEDKEIIDIFTENSMMKFAIEVSPRQWTIFDKKYDNDDDTYLTHDLTNDSWRGCGPTEAERAFGCVSLGQGEKGRRNAMKFAKSYGEPSGKFAHMLGGYL